jgi:DNA-binding MarR family transcriptional regulator
MAKLMDVIEVFRLMDREVPAQVISTFLYIASHNPCHAQALGQDLTYENDKGEPIPMHASAVSRNTDWLSEKHRLNKPGLNLITKEVDPFNRRRQILRLTPKGEKLARKLRSILYG